jgi:enamine deaminase RidA (YjgF/YER057c/UK114 family)
MSSKSFVNTACAPSPGLYSQAVLVDPLKHNLLFLSGQTGNNPFEDGEPVVSGGYLDQAKQALSNLLAVILGAGGKASDFVSLQIFVKDSSDRGASRKAINEAYKQFFQSQGVEKLPARAFIWVSEIPLEYPEEDTLVEICGVAAIPKKD